MSSSQSREHMRIVTLESELKQAKFALTEIKVSLSVLQPDLNFIIRRTVIEMQRGFDLS